MKDYWAIERLGGAVSARADGKDGMIMTYVRLCLTCNTCLDPFETRQREKEGKGQKEEKQGDCYWFFSRRTGEEEKAGEKK